MAIVQISRITNRKGNYENLPQLSGAELGWATDDRRLFIGNGTLESGAPVVGNTEILTEFSDITVLSNYTYKDVAVGYTAVTGPDASSPTVRNVQTKLDDLANVRDFGAVGNGIADDTAAINRALYQLFCREANTQVRRVLYFPAGTYKVTETINIPTYAKIIGEGITSATILLDTSSDISSLSAYVARTADSKCQTGANIGTNNAIPPKDIEIDSIAFKTSELSDVFLVDRAESVYFNNVSFEGPVTQAEIEAHGSTPLPSIQCVVFGSSAALSIKDIVFDQCHFTQNTYAFNTSSETVKSVNIINSKFYNLLQGVATSSTVTGVRVFKNTFDNIYSEGIAFGAASMCASGFNIFYNVGDQIGGSVTTPVVTIGNESCLSNGDLFQRTDAAALIQPRISVTSTGSGTGTTSIQLGRLAIGQGNTFVLVDGAVSQPIFTVNASTTKAFTMTYTITRNTDVRHGTLRVASGPDDSTDPVVQTDDYTENTNTGITLLTSQATDQVTVAYTANTRSINGILTYTITNLN